MSCTGWCWCTMPQLNAVCTHRLVCLVIFGIDVAMRIVYVHGGCALWSSVAVCVAVCGR